MAGFFSSTAGHILIALLAPVAWGILSAWLFERLRARRACAAPRDEATAPRRPRRGRR